MEKMIELYQKYTDALEARTDDREVLAQLRNYSLLSNEGKELYEKAVLAQLFFYEKETIEEMPRLLKAFNANLAANRQAENIWSYLNDLLHAKNLTWSKVFVHLGKSTHLSSQMATGNLNLDRLPASLLADIAKMLDANFDKLCALVKQNLSNPQCSTRSAVHFRKSPKIDEPLQNAYSANRKTELDCNQYLDDLRKHFANR